MKQTRPMFRVTRLFTAGTLAGLIYTEISGVHWHAGQTVEKPYGNTSPYRIILVERL